MGWIDDEKKRLGLTTSSSKSSSAQVNTSEPTSWIEKERASLSKSSSAESDNSSDEIKTSADTKSKDKSSADKKKTSENKLKVFSAKEIVKENKKARDALDPKNPALKFIKDNTVDRFASAVDTVMYKTRPGRVLSRFGEAAAKTTGAPVVVDTKLKSKAANKLTDAAGTLAGALVNPSAIGMGQNVETIYNLTSKLGGKTAAKVFEKTGSKALAKATGEGARQAVAGAAANTMLNLNQQKTSGKELAQGVVEGAAFGAATGAVTPVLGQAANKLFKKNKSVTEIAQELVNESNKKLKTPTKTLGKNTTIKTDLKMENVNKVKNVGFATPEELQAVKDRVVSSTKPQKISTESIAKEGYQQIVDDKYAFKTIDKLAEEVTGQKIAMKDRTYEQALASRGSDVISHQILTKGLVDLEGNVVGKSMKEALSKVQPKAMKDFDSYLLNKHAITRYQRGEQVFDLVGEQWTPEMGQRIINTYEKSNPEFIEAADEFYKFYENVNQHILVDGDLIPQQVKDSWIKENPFYVSNQREFSPLEKRIQGVRAKLGFAGQRAPVNRYSKTGSGRKIISPVESAIRHVESSVKAAKRNKVVVNLYNMVMKDREAFSDIVEVIELTPDEKAAQLAELQQTLSEGGVDAVATRMNEMFEKSAKPDKLGLDNVVKIMVQGEPVHLRIKSPELLDAVTSYSDPGAQNILIKMFGAASRGVKRVTTGANPFFSVMVNLPRDIPFAFMASKTTNNPFRYSYDLVEGFLSALGDKELYQSFKNMGGGHNSAVAANRNLLGQSVREVIGKKSPLDYVKSGFNALENFTNALEAAPRLGEYKRITTTNKKAFKPWEGTSDYETKVKGLFEANDITVNFSRRGKTAPGLDSFFLYWNAAVQGIDKNIRMFKDNPVAASTKAVSAITVPAMVLYAANHDNPDYQMLSDNVKDNFYVIPSEWLGGEKGKFVKVPVPQGLGAAFKAVPERLLREFAEKDPEAFRNFQTTVINNFLPPGVNDTVKFVASGSQLSESNPFQSTILGPRLDLLANKNFYGGTIVPGSMEGNSPQFQYDARTSDIAKTIGKLTKRSPKEIDYLIKGYSGGIGQFGLPLATEGTSFSEALTRKATVDPAFSNDIIDKFYEAKTEIDKQYNDAMDNFGQAKGYTFEKYQDMAYNAEEISKLRADMKFIEQRKDLSEEQKKKMLRENQLQMVAVAKRAYDAYKGYKK